MKFDLSQSGLKTVITAGIVALVAIGIVLNWAEPVSAQNAAPAKPDTPTLRALHKGMVEVDWNDVSGANRYEVQFYMSSGWTDMPDAGLGIEIFFYGSRAVATGLPEDLSYDAFHVRAGNSVGWSEWSEYAWQMTTHLMDWEGVPVPAIEEEPPAPTNTPATGVPVISGTSQVGETLTADTSGIADDDGLTNVSYGYQWARNDGTDDSDISGATSRTYTLVEADQGKTIKVKVSFTDDADNDETLTSAATGEVEALPNWPATGGPTISGTAQVGEPLTAETSGIADDDGLSGATFSYQWIANDGTSDTDITGATDSSYTLVAADESKTIKVRVSFTDDAGNEETLTSTATDTVSFAVQQQASNNPATGAPTISGTARAGRTLTVDTSNISDGDGMVNVTFGYQWISNDGTTDTDITDETSSTYTIKPWDLGKYIKARVSFTDDAGNEETLTSSATTTVAASPDQAPTGGPIISGMAEVGQSLYAVVMGIRDGNGMTYATFSYQWIRNDGTTDSDIPGATGTPYTLTDTDEGKTIKVRVSFTDDGANAETLTSAATGAVAAAPPSYITVFVSEDRSDRNNIVTNFTVTWSDSGDCSTNYNAYLNIEPGTRPGHETPGTQLHLGSAPSDGAQITKGLTGVHGSGEDVNVELYCGTEESGQLVKMIDIPGISHPMPGTYSSAPLTALTISSGTLSPDFDRGIYLYTAEVPSDVESITLNPVVLTGFQTDIVKDPSGYVGRACSTACYAWVYGDGTTYGIVLSDADTSTDGFQVNLDPGENRLLISVNKGPVRSNFPRMYHLTVTVQNSTATVQNTPATGAPTISGTAQVGETLTVDTSGISDVDGLDSVSFSYQWLSSRDTEISGATDATHILAASDEGKTIKVRVSFTDDEGNDESLTSAATAAVVAEDPQPQEPPAKPTGLTGTVSHDAVSLSWDDSGDESITGYQILRLDKALHAIGEFLVHLDDTGSASPEYVDEDVTLGVRYVYRIKARNAAGLSERSEWFNANMPPQTDTTAPTISSVAITSDPDAGDAREEGDGVYGIGDAIEVTLTFNENVTVTGTPRLELYIGGTRKTAAYESVVGNVVVFSYTVAERDNDTDGIAIGANRLTLNGGSIKDAADNDADLSHDALSAQEDHEVDGIRPRVRDFHMSSNRYNSDRAYTIGEIISVGVTWSGNGVSVTGNPQLTLDFNGTSKTSNYVDGWLGRFSEYTVEEGDSAPDGVAIPANAISLNGGSINDRAGNDAVLTHSAAAADTLSSQIIPVDGIRPTVTSVEIVSDPGDADTYGAGDVIKVLVTFSENIVTFVTWLEDVDGEVRPTIELNIGGEARIADYYSRSGTTVTFAYTVQSGDTDDDGISIEANKVWAGPVTPGLDLYLIRDLPSPMNSLAGNWAHDVTHEAIADDSGHKVDGPSSTLIISGESLVYHTENEEKRMGYYRVSGADGDITWSLSGDDSDDFSFTKTGTGTQGVFYFQSPPNYEDPTDSDADNEYRVTLNVSDGTNTKTWPVVVLVVNALFDADEVPVIVGEARVGETLTVDLSNITYDSTTMKMYYLWARIDGDTATRVGESTDSSYTLTADDVGKTVGLTLSVLARDFHLLVSEPTAVVSGSGSLNNPATGQPTISGTAQVGETLSAGTSGIADTDGLNNVSFSYQWIRNDGNSDTDITSETESTYILVADDEGKTIKVRVTFTDDAGDGESLTSTATATVTARPNTPATGAPIISGTAQVGETLTADTSGISDVDGLDSVSFSYQWLSSRDTEISGATDATHMLAASDEGKTIKVRVSFTDDAANEETLTSAATAEVVAAAPTDPAGRPRNLTGTANADGTVTLRWDAPNDDSVTGYQILRRRPREGENTLLVHVNDTGSTATEYTDNDVTHDVLHTYRVKAINAVGLSRQSNFVGVTPTLPAEPAQNSPATGAPTINGTAQVGQTLTVYTSGIADADGLSGATFSYQWIANDGTSDTDITGETDFTYILVAADEGKTIKVRVSFTDDAGNEETLTSAATVSVAARPNSPATGAPIIGGTVQVGETLTADTSGIADADGLSGATFSYQWVANDGGTDADISSETDATYTLGADDEGKTIKVKVTFTDDAGNEEALTSGATDAVAAADPPAEPTGLSATVVSHDTVTITWDDPQDDSITGYVILRRDRAIHPTGTFVTLAGDTGSAQTTYTDETVEPDKEYVYRIKAINEHGEVSERSDWVRGFTPAAPPTDSPATGEPTITGTAQVGEMLTVDTSRIADDDGLVNATYTYQWVANDGTTDTNISGATDNTYTLVDDDEGMTIKVRVTIIDDAENETTLTSAATEAVGFAVQQQGASNTPATGQPTISGTAQVGEMLTADTTGIADEDGLEDVAFSYQWLSDDAEIGGATGSTYTPVADDEGKTITVQVSFTDDGGNDETLTSTATDVVAEAARPNSPATGAPAITGTAQVGETLTADTTGIADEDGLEDVAFSYQWLSDDAEIGGATGSTYTPVADDEGKTITVQVSFTDDLGNETTLTSAATEAVAAAPQPDSPATGEPTITGTAQVGQTLSVDTSGITDADGLDSAVFAYQWLSDDAEIGGATGSTYTLVDDDEGRTIKVRVTVTDDLGNETTLTSAATEAVAAAPQPDSPATGEPTITGTAQVGQTLSVDTSGIADADGLEDVAFSYQWLSDDAGIGGATGSTYTLVDDDEGRTIKVRVTVTDDLGNETTLTSAATEAVEAKRNTAATGRPTISGTVRVGETLTADTTGIADADGLTNVSYRYQWVVTDGSAYIDISGEKGATYTLVSADRGLRILVRVSFTDDAGKRERLTSAATDVVAAAA